MSLPAPWRGLTENAARTEAASPDPRLRGRTYAIPFERVWRAALALAAEPPGWRVVGADDLEGVIRAETTSRLFHRLADVQIRVTLDENAQTRVDARSASRTARADLGANARRLRRFFRRLDRALARGAASSGSSSGTAPATPPPPSAPPAPVRRTGEAGTGATASASAARNPVADRA